MNFNTKSLEVWERSESPETKSETKEKKQETLDRPIKPIEQVRNECLSNMASTVMNFVYRNFPKFDNYKLEFSTSSKNMSGEFTDKIMNLLSKLETNYPNKKNIISEYKMNVFGEINNLFNQLKSITSITKLSNIIKDFKEKKDLVNGRTFYPSK